MKKNIKILIILIIILSLYTVIVFAISKINNKNPENNNGDNNNDDGNDKDDDDDNDNDKEDEKISLIVLSPNTVFKYQSNKWKVASNTELVDKKFEIYEQNNYLGSLFMSFNTRWYIYDDSHNFIDYENDLIGLNGEDLSILEFNESEITEPDKTNISKYLTDQKITFNLDDMSIKKVTYDLNTDGIREEIYSISNGENEANYNKAFRIVLAKYYDGFVAIYENIQDLSQDLTICNPNIQNIIKFKEKRNLIISCVYFSDRGTEHYLYEVNDKTFTKVVGSQIK